MGMAASQARFLGLTARKNNTEYEGQQINQQRTSLANQSAGLFNEMLTLKVPTPPLATNYAKTVFVYTDPSKGEKVVIDYIFKNPEEDTYTVDGSYPRKDYMYNLRSYEPNELDFATKMQQQSV